MGHQAPRVIVDVLREQARSYTGTSEKPESATGHQARHVIVDVLREQARSYTGTRAVNQPATRTTPMSMPRCTSSAWDETCNLLLSNVK